MNLKLKPISGHPSYAAGSDGCIHSFKGKSPRRLKAAKYGTGMRYLFVALSEGGVVTHHSVHVLICAAFHGSAPSGMESSHVSGDRYDNRPANLVWETRKVNLARRIAHGTDDCGVRNSRALFNAIQLGQIRARIASGEKLRSIASSLGCDERAIGKIKREERYAR